MLQAFNCPTCGAANKLPEDKNSMFCAYCGTYIKIEVKNENTKNTSKILSKPTITKGGIDMEESVPLFSMKTEIRRRRVSGGWEVEDEWTGVTYYPDVESESGGGELSLKNRGINNLGELFDWYTDSELLTIKILDLSNNNIQDITDINKLENLEILILASNKISCVPRLDKLKNLSHFDLSNNPIVDFDLQKNDDVDGGYCYINLQNCGIKELPTNFKQSLSKLIHRSGPYHWEYAFDLRGNSVDLNDVFFAAISNNQKKYPLCAISVLYATDVLKPNNSNEEVIDLNWFFKHFEKKYSPASGYPSSGISSGYSPKVEKDTSSDRTTKKDGCFIATATMGSYDHPTVMELRYFRDNWILEKSWGAAFVKWYYHYGAEVAKIIERSFILKKLSYLLVVKPLYYFSKQIINRKKK